MNDYMRNPNFNSSESTSMEIVSATIELRDFFDLSGRANAWVASLSVGCNIAHMKDDASARMLNNFW